MMQYAVQFGHNITVFMHSWLTGAQIVLHVNYLHMAII